MHLPASDAEKIDVALSEGDGESLFILHPGRKAGFLSVCAALPFEPVSVFSETRLLFFSYLQVRVGSGQRAGIAEGASVFIFRDLARGCLRLSAILDGYLITVWNETDLPEIRQRRDSASRG